LFLLWFFAGLVIPQKNSQYGQCGLLPGGLVCYKCNQLAVTKNKGLVNYLLSQKLDW